MSLFLNLRHLASGGLLVGRQPLEDVLHGRIRSKVPAEDPPQGLFPSVGRRPSGQDPVLRGLQVHEVPLSQPQCPSGRRRRWA